MIGLLAQEPPEGVPRGWVVRLQVGEVESVHERVRHQRTDERSGELIHRAEREADERRPEHPYPPARTRDLMRSTENERLR